MLTAMLPTSLCVPSDERHPHQTMVVDMVGDVTEEVASRMKTGIDAAAARVEELRASRPELDHQKCEAEAKLVVVLATVDAKKIESSDASVQVAEAKALLSEKQQALKAAEGPLKPVRKEKESLETMLSTDFKALRDPAEWEAGKVKKRCNAIVSLAKKLSFDESLTTSLSGSLSKKPDERTQFDGMVLQQFEVGVSEKVQQLGATLEAGSISIASCVSAVEEAQGEFEKRKEVADSSAAALKAAQSEHREVSANLQIAIDAIGNYLPEMKQACDLHEAKVEELKIFQEWNVFCYKSLKERVSAKRSKEISDVVVETEEAAVALEEKEDLGPTAPDETVAGAPPCSEEVSNDVVV